LKDGTTGERAGFTMPDLDRNLDVPSGALFHAIGLISTVLIMWGLVLVASMIDPFSSNEMGVMFSYLGSGITMITAGILMLFVAFYQNLARYVYRE